MIFSEFLMRFLFLMLSQLKLSYLWTWIRRVNDVALLVELSISR